MSVMCRNLIRTWISYTNFYGNQLDFLLVHPVDCNVLEIVSLVYTH